MSPFEERRFYAARLRGIAVLLSTTLILLTPVAALATEVLTPLGRQGKAVLTRFCSECHAVGRTGASPNPAAPAFRTIDRRYPLESLRQTLADIGGDIALFRCSGHAGVPHPQDGHSRGDRILAIDPKGLKANWANDREHQGN
jgi:mono/diheme cytochrome c family protein